MRRLGWGELTMGERSLQYARWLEEPEVGGRLAAFMTPAKARVWIKDGPAKEYQRAVAGVGRYAHLTASRTGEPARIVTRVLGSGWSADVESVRVKPLRVVATSTGEEDVIVT